MSKHLTKSHNFFEIGSCYKILAPLTFWDLKAMEHDFSSTVMDSTYRFTASENSMVVFLGICADSELTIHYLFLVNGKKLIGPGVCSYEEDLPGRFRKIC